MPDLSVLIPSRGPILGLWSTIAACEAHRNGLNVEYVVLLNGREREEPEHLLERYGEEAGIRVYYRSEPVPYPEGRGLLAQFADSERLVFLDDHCIPQAGFFEKVNLHLSNPEVHFLHGSYSTFVGGPRYFHSVFFDDSLARGDYATRRASDSVYRCAAAPHNFMATTKKAWKEHGGYHPSLPGYGRDELYFSLTGWAKWLQSWLDPDLHVYHFSPRERDYPRPRNDLWGPELDTARLHQTFADLHVVWN